MKDIKCFDYTTDKTKRKLMWKMINKLEEKDKEIERLNNIIDEAIDKAKTMKVSMLLDAVDGIDIDSQFVDALFELIDFLEKKRGEDNDKD